MACDGDPQEVRSVRRLFLPGKLADTVTLTGSDAHHLGYTLRARVGERCVVVDAERAVASMEIVGFTADTVTLRLVERLAADTESPIRLALAVCLLKSDKMDFVVQKAVELGAATVQPLESENCVARYDGKKAETRRERWQRVADEAAKQCGRTALLEVAPILPFGEWLAARPEEDGAAFFCYEAEEEKTAGEEGAEEKAPRVCELPTAEFAELLAEWREHAAEVKKKNVAERRKAAKRRAEEG